MNLSMPDGVDHILDLISGYLLGELNARQKQELDQWVRSSSHNRMLFDQLTDPAGIKNDLLQMGNIDGQPVWEQIRREIPGLPVQFKDASSSRQKRGDHHRKPSRYRWWTVALIVGILSGPVLWLVLPQKDPVPSRVSTVNCDCVPPLQPMWVDPTKISLILSNGAVITLDEQRPGASWKQGNMLIARNDKGIEYKAGLEYKGGLEYKAAGENSSPQAPVLYNTIKTPPGKAYFIQWPDGSNTWLSAGSVLRFPVSFTGNERRVELTGEAFFTANSVKGQPFLVLAKGTISQVFSTAFNVRAYPAEEGVRTTVEKGKVTVKIDKDSAVVSAGEEARLTAANGWQVSKPANAANAGSWRSGVLEFDKAPLEEVLPRVAEWYAYKTEWQPGASSIGLMTGSLNITGPITNVVKAIEKKFMVRIEVDTDNKVLRIHK